MDGWMNPVDGIRFLCLLHPIIVFLPAFQGSYGGLDGGSSLWAFQCLTGNYACKFKLEGNAWKRYELVYPKDKNGSIMLQPTPDTMSSDDMFLQLMWYIRKRSVVGASSGSGSDKENINGIVQVPVGYSRRRPSPCLQGGATIDRALPV